MSIIRDVSAFHARHYLRVGPLKKPRHRIAAERRAPAAAIEAEDANTLLINQKLKLP
jgi:hypothetical protein